MNAESWQEVCMDELKAPKKWALNGGPFGSKLVRRDYVGSGVPVIRGVNLSGDTRFSESGFVFVSEEKADELLANNAHPGDVVFTQRGTLGQVGVIPEHLGFARFVISQSQMKLTVASERADPLFIYYVFRDPQTIARLQNQAFSSGVPHINLAILREFRIHLPPLLTQRKIASILSAYDDLIENNLKRIQILEEMAQNLYREWFVHFRFPGHENLRLLDSELGKIPEGWAIKTLSECCRKVTDGTHDTPKPVDDGFYLVTGKHLVGGFIDFSQCYRISLQDHVEVMKRSNPERGDIIFSNIGTLGSTVLVDQDFEFSIKNVALFKPISQELSSFLYLHFSSPFTLRELLAQSSGTSQSFFSLTFLRALPIRCPVETLQRQFHLLISPLLQLRSTLARQNLNLRSSRDLLLPKFISGELDVSGLDIGIGEEVA